MLFLAVSVPILAAEAPAKGRMTTGEIHDLFSQAKERFREAVRSAKDDPGRARPLFDESILRFRRIVGKGGIHNGKLYYNIGNAYMLKGDTGRAILNYRRAERLMPDDTRLRQNLEFARSRVPDRIPVRPRKRILSTLFFWHYDLAAATRAGLFLIAFNLIWLLGFLGLARLVRFRLRVPVVVLGLICALLVGSLLVEEVSRREVREGVVVAGEVVGRKGPDATGYEPSFKEPLHAGVEFEVVEDRSEWVLVRLNDDRETWLPRSALEEI
jgi:hypothetical protein